MTGHGIDAAGPAERTQARRSASPRQRAAT
jgi:hypothetical protein